MTTPLREVVADALPEEYADALDALWAAHRCKNDDPIYRRFLAFLPRLHALATTPAASEGVEERARELLAAEYERGGMEGAAAALRRGDNGMDFTIAAALDAIAAALRTPAASVGGGGRFVACRCVSERDRELCMSKDECSKVYAFASHPPSRRRGRWMTLRGWIGCRGLAISKTRLSSTATGHSVTASTQPWPHRALETPRRIRARGERPSSAVTRSGIGCNALLELMHEEPHAD